MLSTIFIVITLTTALLFYFATGKNRSVLLYSSFWIIIAGILAINGFFEDTVSRPPTFLLVPLMAILMIFFFSKWVSRSTIDHHYLLGIHTLRIPIELVLFQLYLRKEVPLMMTFEGLNFDIVSGITALLILVYLLWMKNKANTLFLISWNILGLILLTVVVTIGVLSAPLPIQQFAFEQPNTAVLKFPFVFLPAYVVPIVFISHILAIKDLSKTKKGKQINSI